MTTKNSLRGYSRWKKKDLLDECTRRGLNSILPKRTTRILISEILKKNDQEKSFEYISISLKNLENKTNSSKKITSFISNKKSIVKLPKSSSLVNSGPKNALVVGLSSSVTLSPLFQDKSHFTGIKGCETIPWFD